MNACCCDKTLPNFQGGTSWNGGKNGVGFGRGFDLLKFVWPPWAYQIALFWAYKCQVNPPKSKSPRPENLTAFVPQQPAALFFFLGRSFSRCFVRSVHARPVIITVIVSARLLRSHGGQGVLLEWRWLISARRLRAWGSSFWQNK
jgi:hypothetical protein